MPKRYSLLLCAVCSWVVLPLRAHTDSLHVRQLQTVEVVETARTRVLKSATPMQTLGRMEMLRMGVTDIADALNRLPGITLRDYGGAGGLKTVNVRGFGAQHTGVSYDGVLLSNCQSGEIDVSRYALDNVESLTLMVGDHADLFIPARQASTAAVLIIETLSQLPADNMPHLTTRLRWGSFGYISPFIRYVQRLGKTFTFSTSGEYVYAENDYPFRLRNITLVTHEHRTNSRMNSVHGEANLLWQPDRWHQLTTKVYYYDNNRQLPGQVRYYTNITGEELHDRNFFVQSRYTQRSHNDSWALRWYGKYNWAASKYRDRMYANGVNDADYWQREAYTSVALLWQPAYHWALDWSADYAFNNLSSAPDAVGRPYRHTVLQTLSGKYVSARWTVLGRVLHSLYLNRVHEGVAAHNMRRWSPSLSASYRLLPDEQLYVRASYKDIFRAPTFNESYYRHYGSATLSPELTHQLNLGVTWGWQSMSQLTGQLSLDGYLNRVTNKIVAVPYNMFVWTNINVGRVDIKGVDASLKTSYRLADSQQLLFSGGYSYQRAANHTNKQSKYYGHQVAYMPLHSGSAAISWQNKWVNVAVHGSGISGRWTNNEHYPGTYVPGYWEIGLSLDKQLHWQRQRLEVRADLKNMLNRQYEIVRLYPMPRMSWQLDLKYEF